MGQVSIERCTDATAIAHIHAVTVRVAYRRFFPAESPPPTVTELCDVWTARLADPTAAVLMARVDGRPVGSVLTRADAQCPGGELAALHVLPAEWGQRIGSELHNAALAELAKAGHETAWLWVIAANERARRMYERRGWTPRPDITQDYLGILEMRYSRLTARVAK
jgi:GNAT superfamily N-acetyltransferase